MLIVTTNEAPGYRVVKTLGLARGITVRSRNAISDMVGGLQSMLGGRVGAYVKLAEASRAEAYQELVDQAQAMGANAVIAMRYEANEIMEGVTEVLAYGTAVVVEPAD
ncbi:MAG TPA: YbjQ family protein [Brevundimonas sp.]|nr:YbjQ family protein [Brevundimonas sp.]